MSCASVCTGCVITEFPQVRRLAFALATYDGAAELDDALDVLLIWPHRHDVGSRRVTFVDVNERHILTHSKATASHAVGVSRNSAQVVSAFWTRRPRIAACVGLPNLATAQGPIRALSAMPPH